MQFTKLSTIAAAAGTALLMPLLMTATPATATGLPVLLSNDDGWAEANIRTLYDRLNHIGCDVLLSAPAEDMSGTGSADAPAEWRWKPCQFDSCPENSPAYGANGSNMRLNYVNSFPLTALRWGGHEKSNCAWGEKPSLTVVGINVGSNLGETILNSGTIGAAAESAEHNIPAIAFSGASGKPISYLTSPMPGYVEVYAQLATLVTAAIIEAGPPFLPPGTWLNVNFPRSTPTECSSAGEFQFVFSRIGISEPIWEMSDPTCGGSAFPYEEDVVNTPGCYASISLGIMENDAERPQVMAAYDKLKGILSCLP